MSLLRNIISGTKEYIVRWRRDQFSLNYSVYRLPQFIHQMIVKMNERFGLKYAAYDFIVTPNHEYYFLELNPQGQWLWIEEITRLPVSKTLAELLLS